MGRRQRTKESGFTIVELIIVIVVIAILAVLAIVAYNGIQTRATIATVKADLASVTRSLEVYKIGTSSNETYPVDLDCSGSPAADTACLPSSDGTTYQYAYDSGENAYCLTATNGAIAFFISSDDTEPTEGACDGHTLPDTGGDDEETPAIGWEKIDGGESFGCGIYDGAAYCWGYNGTQGRFGTGNTTDSSVPVPVSTSGVLAGKTIVDIAVGSSHGCVLTSDNGMYCWGYNSVGQLGNNHVGDTGGGSFPYARSPVAVDVSGVLAGKTITAIAAQNTTTCAVADGANYCWGENGWSQRGASGGDTAVPVAVSTSGALGGKTFGTVMGAGHDHACSVDSNALIYCWGYNYFGQVGNSATGTTSVASAVTASGVLSGKSVTAISAGEVHTCVIASGLGYCWGRELDGRLGNGGDTNISRSAPLAVNTAGVLSGKTLTAITSSNNGSCTVADGLVYCWGLNNYGEAGTGAAGETLYPTAVTTSGVLSGKTLVSLGSGRFFSCAIDSAADAYCWGRNNTSQLGNGTTSSYSASPVQLTDPS